MNRADELGYKKWYMVFLSSKRIRKYVMKKYKASSVNPNYARTI